MIIPLSPISSNCVFLFLYFNGLICVCAGDDCSVSTQHWLLVHHSCCWLIVGTKHVHVVASSIILMPQYENKVRKVVIEKRRRN